MRTMKPADAPCMLLGAALILSGCRALVPYDSEFACAKSHDFGRCMDVQSAYEEARANVGTTIEPSAKPTRPPQPSLNSAPAGPLERRGALLRELAAPADGAEHWRDARYRELAGLIEEPVTPVVEPPKVLRTLIVSYGSGDALYMPRYIYYLAEPARFVLGDYLLDQPAERILHPNGAAERR